MSKDIRYSLTPPSARHVGVVKWPASSGISCRQQQTKNWGSYQNPQDLSADTWKLVRFADGTNGNGKVYWNFFSDQCRHCLSPGCMAAAEKDEIVQDEKTGAVIFTPKTKDLDFKATLEGCPYNIPRQDPKTKVLFKCTMCFDRISEQPDSRMRQVMPNRDHGVRRTGQDPGSGQEASRRTQEDLSQRCGPQCRRRARDLHREGRS